MDNAKSCSFESLDPTSVIEQKLEKKIFDRNVFENTAHIFVKNANPTQLQKVFVEIGLSEVLNAIHITKISGNFRFLLLQPLRLLDSCKRDLDW